MSAVLAIALPFLKPIIGTAVGAAATWLSVHLGAFIQAKVKNQRAQTALLLLDDAVLTAVKEAEQVATDSSGNKLQRAVNTVVGHLGTVGLEQVTKGLGLSGNALVDAITQRIEAAVNDHFPHPADAKP